MNSVVMSWSRVISVIVSVVGLLHSQPARATDFIVLRGEAATGAQGPSIQHGLTYGLDYDFFIDRSGGRLGVGAGLLSLPDASPRSPYAQFYADLAAHLGRDGDRSRLYLALRPTFVMARGASVLHSVGFGPEVELRDLQGQLRWHLGVAYNPGRDAEDDWRWGGILLRTGFSFGVPTDPPPKAWTGPLCPDGAPPLPGIGCAAVP